MPYTTMTDLSTGSLVTETIWDNQVQGNIEYLLGQSEPTLTNKSGGSVDAGDLVINDSSNDTSFTTTTTSDDTTVIGVAMATIANNASGRVAQHGSVTVNVTGTVTRGDWLRSSTTAKKAESAGTVRTEGTFAVAQTSDSGGTVTALLLPSGSGASAALGSNTWGGNLIKNFPSLEAADGAQPEWWEVSAGTLTEEDATGESIAQKHERVLKFTTTNSNDYLYQQLTYADESTLDISTTVVSGGCWVYQKSSDPAGTITLDLFDNSAGSLGTATTTTEDSWVWLEVFNKTLGAGANLQFRISHSASAGVIYVTMPTFNAGGRARTWVPRGLKFVDIDSTAVVSAVDPGGASWTDVDCTSATGNNAVIIIGDARYQNQTTADQRVFVRTNGSSDATGRAIAYAGTTAAVNWTFPYSDLLVDDGQIFEYQTGAGAGDTEEVTIRVSGYWEWA